MVVSNVIRVLFRKALPVLVCWSSLPLFPLKILEYRVLSWCLQTLWSCVLCKIRERNSALFFLISISTFPDTICWRQTFLIYIFVTFVKSPKVVVKWSSIKIHRRMLISCREKLNCLRNWKNINENGNCYCNPHPQWSNILGSFLYEEPSFNSSFLCIQHRVPVLARNKEKNGKRLYLMGRAVVEHRSKETKKMASMVVKHASNPSMSKAEAGEFL